jgi:nitrogen regulatory protein P-II 1
MTGHGRAAAWHASKGGAMKEVKAIARPAQLDRVSDALRKLPGFPEMSVGKVEGCSRLPSGQNPRNPR